MTTVCTEECPYGYWEDVNTLECVTCRTIDDHCADCDMLGNCLVCEFPTYLHEGRCVSPCDDGFWGNTATNTCDECHDSCATCSCGTYDCCITCRFGSYWHDFVCDYPCPDGYYANVEDLTCYECHDTCLTCNGGDFN